MNTDSAANITGTAFESNTAHRGGALYSNRANVQIFADTTTFFQNSAAEGGAIYNNHGNTTVTGSSKFANNTASDQVRDDAP